jgi:ElaB/YqjD/DUF883 family membrane-anchored ribosome-binding protein
METYFENLVQAQSAMARERGLQDLKASAHDSEALLIATAGDLSEKAKGARARLTDALRRAKAACAQLQEQTIASAKVVGKRADIVIREHPYQSIGIAFGIGLVVGLLVARK